MATIGRGAAVVQFRRGRTMKGKAASLAWGTVHLALLSTGEDRAKAMVDWTWAGFSHERPGRITVRTERNEAARLQRTSAYDGRRTDQRLEEPLIMARTPKVTARTRA